MLILFVIDERSSIDSATESDAACMSFDVSVRSITTRSDASSRDRYRILNGIEGSEWVRHVDLIVRQRRIAIYGDNFTLPSERPDIGVLTDRQFDMVRSTLSVSEMDYRCTVVNKDRLSACGHNGHKSDVQHVDVHTVFCDRVFDANGVRDTIDRHDMIYLIPKRWYETELTDIKKLRRESLIGESERNEIPEEAWSEGRTHRDDNDEHSV